MPYLLQVLQLRAAALQSFDELETQKKWTLVSNGKTVELNLICAISSACFLLRETGQNTLVVGKVSPNQLMRDSLNLIEDHTLDQVIYPNCSM